MTRALAVALAAAALLAGCTSSKKDSCTYPDIKCGDRCLDGASDPANCGACGHACGASETCCNSQCVDVHGTGSTTPLVNNCGACGHRCPTAGSCNAGTCECPVTLPTTCGSAPGECVDLAIDPDHCSTCGFACAGTGVTAGQVSCSAGACQCTNGATACGGRCANTQVDPANCGGCGTHCPPHATCASGGCTCGNAAYPNDCGATLGCVNWATDASNCGGCANACTPGSACSGGRCCPTGQTWCASASACVDTQTSASNCGSCGHACAAGQTCSAGSCGCSGATPLACGSSCCGGTACCQSGTTCQPDRHNGLNATTFFFGCAGASLDRSFAVAAANSWQAGVATYDLFCAGNCVARQTGSSCAMWCYDGTYVGRVAADTTSIVCDALCTKFINGQSTSWP